MSQATLYHRPSERTQVVQLYCLPCLRGAARRYLCQLDSGREVARRGGPEGNAEGLANPTQTPVTGVPQLLLLIVSQLNVTHFFLQPSLWGHTQKG